MVCAIESCLVLLWLKLLCALQLVMFKDMFLCCFLLFFKTLFFVFFCFYPRDAMLVRVCESSVFVRLSHAGIVSKQRKLAS